MAQIENDIVPCDLTAGQHDFPCLNCLSESQLWMVAFVVMNFLYNRLNTQDKTPTERLQELACNTCLSDKQVLQAVVAKLVDIAAQLGYTAEAGLQDASCAQCADPQSVRFALASLLCGIIGEQIIL